MELRNYYEILGVEPNCTKNEITKSYRSLAKKYHPDKHKGNANFTDKFIEITKAYNVLRDKSLRDKYDINLPNNKYSSNESSREAKRKTENPKTAQREQTTNSVSPGIITFDTNKISFTIGESITFIWEVSNADKIELSPFGFVNAKGVKTVKIKENGISHLTVKLIATNISNGKSVSKTLSIPRANRKKTNDNIKFPKIIHFYPSKFTYESDEPISFFWETTNADKIELIPFGQVDANGVKIVKIKEKGISILTVRLIATDTITGQTVFKELQIRKSDKDNLNQGEQPIPNSKNQTYKRKELDPGLFVLGIVLGIAGLWCLGMCIMAISNWTSGIIEGGAALFVLIFLLPLTCFLFFMCFVLCTQGKGK